MEFIFRNASCQSGSESDYETAVDMSHHSWSTTTALLETPLGLILELTEDYGSVTHSYLEPDFDVFEASGATVYTHNADHSDDREWTHYRALIYYPRDLSADEGHEVDNAGFSEKTIVDLLAWVSSKPRKTGDRLHFRLPAYEGTQLQHFHEQIAVMRKAQREARIDAAVARLLSRLERDIEHLRQHVFGLLTD